MNSFPAMSINKRIIRVHILPLRGLFTLQSKLRLLTVDSGRFISFLLGRRTSHSNGKCLSTYINTFFGKGKEKRIEVVK